MNCSLYKLFIVRRLKLQYLLNLFSMGVFSLLSLFFFSISAQASVGEDLANEQRNYADNQEISSLDLIHTKSLNGWKIRKIRAFLNHTSNNSVSNLCLLSQMSSKHKIECSELQQPLLFQDKFVQHLHFEPFHLPFDDAGVTCHDFIFLIENFQRIGQVLCSEGLNIFLVKCDQSSCNKALISTISEQLNSLEFLHTVDLCVYALINNRKIKLLDGELPNQNCQVIEEHIKTLQMSEQSEIQFSQQNYIVYALTKTGACGLSDLMLLATAVDGEVILRIDDENYPISYLTLNHSYVYRQQILNFSFHPSHNILFARSKPIIYNQSMIWFDDDYSQVPVSQLALDDTGNLLFQAVGDILYILLVNYSKKYIVPLNTSEMTFDSSVEIIHVQTLGPQQTKVMFSRLGIFNQILERPSPENLWFETSLIIEKTPLCIYKEKTLFSKVLFSESKNEELHVIQYTENGLLYIEKKVCAEENQPVKREVTDLLLTDDLIQQLGQDLLYVCNNFTQLKIFGSNQVFEFGQKIISFNLISIDTFQISAGSDYYQMRDQNIELKPSFTCGQFLISGDICIRYNQQILTIFHRRFQILLNQYQFEHPIQQIFVGAGTLIIWLKSNSQDNFIQYQSYDAGILKIKELPLFNLTFDETSQFFIFDNIFSLTGFNGSQRMHMLYNLSRPPNSCLYFVQPIEDEKIFVHNRTHIMQRVSLQEYHTINLKEFLLKFNISESFAFLKYSEFQITANQNLQHLVTHYKIKLFNEILSLIPLLEGDSIIRVQEQGIFDLELSNFIRGEVLKVESTVPIIKPLDNLIQADEDTISGKKMSYKSFSFIGRCSLIYLQGQIAHFYDIERQQKQRIYTFKTSPGDKFFLKQLTINNTVYAFMLLENSYNQHFEIVLFDPELNQIYRNSFNSRAHQGKSKIIRSIITHNELVFFLYEFEVKVYEVSISSTSEINILRNYQIEGEFSNFQIISNILILYQARTEGFLLLVYAINQSSTGNVDFTLISNSIVEFQGLYIYKEIKWQYQREKQDLQFIDVLEGLFEIEFKLLLKFREQLYICSLTLMKQELRYGLQYQKGRISVQNEIIKRWVDFIIYHQFQNNVIYTIEHSAQRYILNVYDAKINKPVQFKIQQISMKNCSHVEFEANQFWLALFCQSAFSQKFELSVLKINSNYQALLNSYERSIQVSVTGYENQKINLRFRLLYPYAKLIQIMTTVCVFFLLTLVVSISSKKSLPLNKSPQESRHRISL